MTNIEVNADALRELLTALKGHDYQVRELLAISNIRGEKCPITILFNNYNDAVEAHNAEVAHNKVQE